MRIAGISIVLVSVVLLLFAALGLWQTEEMAGTLGVHGAAQGQAFDAENWASHWRFSARILLLLGIAGIIAGVGLIRRRRWGLALWCGLITSLLCGQIAMNVWRLAKYAFEETGWVEMTVVAALCAVSWFALWRVSRSAAANRVADVNSTLH